MLDPFAFVSQAAGGGGISLDKDIIPTAVQSGDLNGPRITFGSSAPGLTTGHIALIAVAGLAGLYIWKKVG